MPHYKLLVTNKAKGGTGIFYKAGNSSSDVINYWHHKHPNTEIISIKEIVPKEEIELTKPCKCKKEITSRQWRNHHKARITQMRNNAISLIDDEDAVITDSERLQLSRIACQLDRILALWPTRQYELNLENHK